MEKALPKPTKPTEAMIKRTIKAWTACGLTVGSVQILSCGAIKIEPMDPKELQKKPANNSGPKQW